MDYEVCIRSSKQKKIIILVHDNNLVINVIYQTKQLSYQDGPHLMERDAELNGEGKT